MHLPALITRRPEPVMLLDQDNALVMPRPQAKATRGACLSPIKTANEVYKSLGLQDQEFSANEENAEQFLKGIRDIDQCLDVKLMATVRVSQHFRFGASVAEEKRDGNLAEHYGQCPVDCRATEKIGGRARSGRFGR